MKRNFLLWNIVKNKADTSIQEIENVLYQLKTNENKIVLKSLFVYGVSTFENALSDILKEFFKAFPEKIPESSFSFSKEHIINNTDIILDIFLESAINKLTYGSLEKYLSTFTQVLAIDKIEQDIDKLIEIKETRNLMVHNNLIVNSIYLSKCKPSCIRADEKKISKELPFDKDYAYNSIELCAIILRDCIVIPLEKKYNSYTKIKAMKEIWEYLFNSLILEFDDYWEYDKLGNLKSFKLDEEDIMSYFKISFSTTEKILVSQIMLHYWGSLRNIDGISIDIFNINALYGERKDKFFYLQNALLRYPQLFKQDISIKN
ncbi:hypothetical protein [Clostridium minihomine]|uniref:hypothetical protein n=1 Tax=Clostridium minihomine TaxID=2045012 RepID=UPI000C7582AC|nr:hypothetical protein [Clostridium minihomine]